MMLRRSRSCVLILAVYGSLSLGILSAAADPAKLAESFPSKSVRIIVPSPPGGISDIAARFIAEGLSRKWGHQVLVENRPGAGGNIGLRAAAAAPADGYTLYATTNSQTVIDPVVDPELAKQNDAFVPVVQLVSNPIVIVAHASSPFGTFADLVAAAKAAPGKYAYATAGVASVPHLAAEWIASAAGIKLRHVPFKGGSGSVAAVASGELPLASVAASTTVPFVRSGRVRPLVVTQSARTPAADNWPLASDAGYPGVNLAVWNGLFVNKDTPPSIVAKIEADASAILADPDFRRRLLETGNEASDLAGKAFAAQIAAETVAVRKVVSDAKIVIK